MRTKICLLALLFIAAFALMSCGASSKTEAKKHVEEQGSNIVALTAEQVELIRIAVGQPEKRQLTGHLTAPARIEALPTKIADIGTLISGRIREIYAVEGERVKKGQVLLEIQGLEIGEIKGEFIRAQAVLKSAEANFRRQEKLLQENIAAEKAYIEAKSAYEEAKAIFSAADQKLHSIGIRDEEAESLIKLATSETEHAAKFPTATLKIYSPIAGVVGNFKVKAGQLLQPETDIMEVVDSEQVWVVADIYEKNLDTVKVGQRVEVLTEAYPDLVQGGTLEYISPVVDDRSRTVKVRSTIQNRDGKLKPEMFATMRIFGNASEPSLVVPQSAVENDGETDFVFVELSEQESDAGVPHQQKEPSNSHDESVAGDNHRAAFRYQKVPVQIGIRQDGLVQIKAGLKGDERIVITGAFFLKSELMKESFGRHGH